MNYINIFVSTEDHESKLEHGQLIEFDAEFVSFLKEGLERSEEVSVDKWLKELYDMRPEYETDSDFLATVDTFRKLIDNKEGVLVEWSVEYDTNIMFVKKSTKEEVVDLVEEMWNEIEND